MLAFKCSLVSFVLAIHLPCGPHRKCGFQKFFYICVRARCCDASLFSRCHATDNVFTSQNYISVSAHKTDYTEIFQPGKGPQGQGSRCVLAYVQKLF
jgi:hypothetical protein